MLAILKCFNDILSMICVNTQVEFNNINQINFLAYQNILQNLYGFVESALNKNTK